MRAAFAYTGEAAARIRDTYVATVGREPGGNEVPHQQEWLAYGGGTLAVMRAAFAHSGEAANLIDTAFVHTLGHHVDGTEPWSIQNALATTHSLADVYSAIYSSSDPMEVILAASFETMDFSKACRLLGVDPNEASGALHAAKRAAGLRGNDNCVFNTRNGNITFRGKQ